MKKLLVFLVVLCGVSAFGQNVPGYTYFNSRQDIFILRGRNGLHAPAGATPALGSGQWVGSGAIYVDSSGGGMGLYYYLNGNWIRLYDTADAIVPSVGNALTQDADSIKWGGTLNEQTTIDAGNLPINFNWPSLAGNTGMRLRAQTTAAAGDTSRVLSVVASGVNAIGSRTTAAGYFQNTHTGAGISGTKSIGVDILAGDTTATNGKATTAVGLRVKTQGLSTSGYEGSIMVERVHPVTSGVITDAAAIYAKMTGSPSSRGAIWVQNITSSTDVSTSNFNSGLRSEVSGVTGYPNVGVYASATNGRKNFAFVAADGFSSFNTTGDTTHAIVGIGAGQTEDIASLNIQEKTDTTDLHVNLRDGDFFHYNDSIYVKAGGVLYNITHAFESPDANLQTWQETLDEGSTLNKANTVDMDGFSLLFNNSGGFTVYDSSATAVSNMQFNQGFDFTTYTGIAGDTLYSFTEDVVNGLKMTAVGVGTNSYWNMRLHELDAEIVATNSTGEFNITPDATNPSFTLTAYNTVPEGSGVFGYANTLSLFTYTEADSSYIRMDNESGLMTFRSSSTGRFMFDALKTSHNAADSMVVWNPTTEEIGYRPIPSAAEPEYNEVVEAYQALGASIKAETVGLPAPLATFNWGMADGQMRLIPVMIKKDETITGVKIFMRTQGNYTADNNNKVGLYSYSGGTYTKVAESADDGNLWKATGSTYITKAFSTPYAATAGLYFVAVLYNQSAQTTAPAISAGVSVNAASQTEMGFTNDAKLFSAVAGQTDLPATIAGSSLTSQTNIIYAAVY